MLVDQLNSLTRKKTQLILGFFLFLLSELGLSNNISIDGVSFTQDELENVAESFRWGRLLSYKDANVHAISANLNLTDTDRFSTLGELKASIKEYLKFSKGESTYFCDAPSRAVLITFVFPQLPTFDPHGCSEYLSWSKQGDIHSISLMYVTGYLQNPASFFGHTLIKFNASQLKGENSLLDSALNYGANTNNDAAVPYVFRGLTGRYSASLVAENFFRLSAEYQEFQKRDIYEYRLVLSDFSRQLLVAYTFEMIQKEFVYYFLSDNCAYRMNLILGLALGEDPMPNLPWSAPIDLLMAVNKLAIVDSISYHPSQTTRTIEAISALSNEEVRVFKLAIEEGTYDYEETEYSIKTKLAFLENLNYLKLKSFKSNNLQEVNEIDLKRKKILLSFDVNEKIVRAKPHPIGYPHEIDKPTLLGYRVKTIKDKGIIHSLRLRGANFELLDSDKTRKNNSEFIFLSPQLSIFNNQPFVDEITIFKVLSLNDSKITIPGEASFSWGVDISRVNLADFCYPCNVIKANGTIGQSYYLSDRYSTYALANVSVHQSGLGSGNMSMSGQAGIIADFGLTKLNLDFKKIEFKSQNIFDREEISLSIKFNISTKRNLLITTQKASDSWSFGVTLNNYF